MKILRKPIRSITYLSKRENYKGDIVYELCEEHCSRKILSKSPQKCVEYVNQIDPDFSLSELASLPLGDHYTVVNYLGGEKRFDDGSEFGRVIADGGTITHSITLEFDGADVVYFETHFVSCSSDEDAYKKGFVLSHERSAKDFVVEKIEDLPI